MKTVCNIITAIALFAFMMALSMMDNHLTAAVIIMFVSGIWLAGYGFAWDEERKGREWW